MALVWIICVQVYAGKSYIYKGFKFVQIALSVKTVLLKFIVDILTVTSTSHLIIETGYIH